LAVSAPATLTVSGVALPGLYNSGVSESRAPLPQGASDPHFRVFHMAPLPPLLQNQPAPVATSVGGWPIPPWLGDSDDSAWITPLTLQDLLGADIPFFHFLTSFDTAGLDQSTASITGRWAVDNAGAEILLNGQPTGNTNPNGYATWTPFAITDGIRPGPNTLAFVVTNSGGPGGVRIELNSRAEATGLNLAALASAKTGNPWLWEGLRFTASTLTGTGKTELTNNAGNGLLWTQVLRVDLPYDCDRADLDLTYRAGELVIRAYTRLDYPLLELRDNESGGTRDMRKSFRLCAAGLRWIELRLEGESNLGDYGLATLANLRWKRSGPVLGLTATTLATNRLALAWPSVMGEDYQLQAADQLDGPWQALRTLTAPAATTRLDVTNSGPQRFFRVRRTLCD
jgi:hypothetical protein